MSRMVNLANRIEQSLDSARRRIQAPLRRIMSRDLEVFTSYRNGHPQAFAVHDQLECGHIKTSLGWDIFDLLNAYTEHPEARAKRHRCQPCAVILSTRKQPRSVPAMPQVQKVGHA